ncbi:MAG: D-alanine--D-alanine ligase [Desulfovibrionaceae bacterium]|nr:D-alanine--D-alanine ligase [Desulfovibrionaceae bacterium]
MRVLLIAGGWSGERKVSLAGAERINSALKRLGHAVSLLDPAEEFARLTRRASASDFAFINLHGAPGEDGLIQAMLERCGCPYQGSGPAASFLALNKAAAKDVFDRQGIPTPEWELICPGWEAEALGLTAPLFVKPVNGGSSLGMTLVHSLDELEPALELVFGRGEAALVERRVEGPELTCAILGRAPLPLVMIRPSAGAAFFDYQSKYLPGGAEETCPAPVDRSVTEAVQDLSLRAHDALGLSGYSRADYILGQDGPMLLEVNTLPGMTPTSLLPQAAAAAGYGFEDLVAELIRLGLEGRS